MKLDVFDKTNKKTGTVEVSESLFAVKWNPDLVHQAFVAFTSNARRPWAHTKDRSEVSGGGKKPWSQKHTGRSRHGSSRSPLWIGGGVTFGPRNEKDYSKKINAKMKKLALLSVLSKKIKDNDVKIVDDLNLEAPKTKKAAEVIKNLSEKRDRVLLVVEPKNKTALLAFRNLPTVELSTPQSLNIYESLLSRKIFFEKDALSTFAKKYEK